MESVLKAKLTGVAYHADNTSTWAREIADEIKSKLKEEGWARYKFVCQVVIGEQRGQGTRCDSCRPSSCRCCARPSCHTVRPAHPQYRTMLS